MMGALKQLENLFIERLEDNQDIYIRLMNDPEFRDMAAHYLMRAVYNQINDQTAAPA